MKLIFEEIEPLQSQAQGKMIYDTLTFISLVSSCPFLSFQFNKENTPTHK